MRLTARRLLALTLLSTLAAGAPAVAAVAPGRVTFPLGDGARHAGVDPLGVSVGVALPDGRVALAGIDRGKGVVLAQLRPDGSLDPSFGAGGIVHVPLPFDTGFVGPEPLQLVQQLDGRLVLLVRGPRASRYQLQQLVLVRLTRDGHLDPAFGNGGVARPGVQASCSNCSPASLQPDGNIVVTGSTGRVPAAVTHDPSVMPDFHWVVARITPSGALDATFGRQGVATLPGANGAGFGAAVLPGGAIAALGNADNGPKLARLTTTGALDPAFHGGTPLTPRGAYSFWPGLVGHAGGSVDVLGSDPGTAQLVRYTATGDLDPNFGDQGAVRLRAGELNALLPAPGEGDLVAGPTTFSPGRKPVGLRVSRIGPDGTVTATASVPIPFGGGRATVFAVHRQPRATSLDQTGFFAGRAFARPDGSLVLPGAVGVVQYTGEGAGYEIDEAAVTAITPSLALDPSFGGPSRPARIRLRVPPQRASRTTNVRVLRVSVLASTSGPGLCLLRVRAGGRVVARSTAPVFFTGRQRLRALLTTAGRRTLRHARHVRVTVTGTFRDLVGSKARASATGILR